MNTDDIKKIKEELQEEIKNNNVQNSIIDERKRITYVNQFENKSFRITMFSGIAYLGTFILTNKYISIIPIEAYPFIITGIPLSIGIIVSNIFDWKFKIKERLKSFTNAKKEAEKLQEEVKYTIDFERIKNKNKIMEQTINILDKDNWNTDSKIQVDEELLNKKYNELDTLTTKKVLIEKFWKVRNKFINITDLIKNVIIIEFISTLMAIVHMFFLFPMEKSIKLLAAQYWLSLSTIIVGVFTGYTCKKNKDYIKAFKNLNMELEENALSNNTKNSYKEKDDINAKIENEITDISIMKAKLYEQKTILESYNNILRKSSLKENKVEEDIKSENIEKDDIIKLVLKK
jgi:hypothetical protein